MRFQRVVAEFVAALTGLVLVAGCTSSPPEPEPLPEPTRSSAASPSPSPSASITPPTLPAKAEGTSPAAAKAFVRHWIAVLNFAGATGDTSLLEQLSSDRCRSCNNFISSIRSAYAAGGGYDGGEWTVTSSAAFEAEREQFLVGVGFDTSEQVGQTSSTAPTTTTAPSSNSAEFLVRHGESGWQVMQFTGERR